jgi:hypothetical protein
MKRKRSRIMPYSTDIGATLLGIVLFILISIPILLSGCAVQEYPEEIYNMPAYKLHCYSTPLLSSHKDIRRGEALAITERKLGKLHVYIPCGKISDKLYISHSQVYSHEAMEVLHNMYPKQWIDPDKLRMRR